MFFWIRGICCCIIISWTSSLTRAHSVTFACSGNWRRRKSRKTRSKIYRRKDLSCYRNKYRCRWSIEFATLRFKDLARQIRREKLRKLPLITGARISYRSSHEFCDKNNLSVSSLYLAFVFALLLRALAGSRMRWGERPEFGEMN